MLVIIASALWPYWIYALLSYLALLATIYVVGACRTPPELAPRAFAVQLPECSDDGEEVRAREAVEVFGSSERELRLLVDELTDGYYLRGGVELRSGDVVFDVGANMGMWSVLLARRFRRLRVVAFEPVPGTFSILEANVKKHVRQRENRIELVKAGASSVPGTAEFRLDPESTISTTLESDPGNMRAIPDTGVSVLERLINLQRAMASDAAKMGFVSEQAAERASALVSAPVVGPIVSMLLYGMSAMWVLAKWHFHTTLIKARMTTVSEVMREKSVDHIDLLKVDVEGCELDVLQGVDDSHWPRIKQVVAEVHDVRGRLGELCALLRSKGFRVEQEQADFEIHKALKIYTVYAVRE